MQKFVKSDKDGTFIISEIDREFRNRIRKYIYIDIVILFIFLPEIVWTGLSAGVFQGICFGLIFIVWNVGAVLFISNRRIKKRNEFVNFLLRFDDEYYMKMCSTAEHSGMAFGSFYVLDDHIFVPDKLIMVAFAQIRHIDVHRTYFRRFPIKIGLLGIDVTFLVAGSESVSVNIKKFRDFAEHEDEFLCRIMSKIQRNTVQ